MGQPQFVHLHVHTDFSLLDGACETSELLDEASRQYWLDRLSELPDSQARYPSQTIKIVVGFAAGGGNDIIARIIGQKLQAIGEISRESYGGVRAVAEMFNRLDSGAGKEIRFSAKR